MQWPTPPAALRLTFLGKLRLSYIRFLSKPLGLKGDSFSRSFFDLFVLIGLGPGVHGSQVYPNIGSYLVYNVIVIVISLACCIFSKALNAYS